MPILEQNMRCFLDGNPGGMVNVVRAACIIPGNRKPDV